MTPAPVIDIVVPVLNEDKNLPRLHREIAEVFAAKLPTLDWRMTFVDDGSRDDSWATVRAMATRHPNVRALRLNRNYGAHVAISAGLGCAAGDAVVVMAADLQDPPAVLPAFVERWHEGFKVVWGVRAGRRDPWHRKFFSTLFHRLVRRYALPTYPSQGTGSFCLIDRTIVENLRRMRENFRTIFGLISIQGYPAAEVPYLREERAHGRSGWSLHKLLRTTVDVFTSYSHLPVRIISWVGFASCLLAFVGMAYQIIVYVLTARAPRGWTMLFSAVCFFGGVQTLALGILGEYIWRTFHEVKHRPLWFVEDATFELERPAP